MLPRPGSGSDSGDQRGDGPAPESTHKKMDVTRKKAWASRSRTGCKTCRARRVRCDEERPECRRCVRGGHGCRGYALPAPGASILAISSKPGVESTMEQHDADEQEACWALARRPEKHVIEIDPPYWDYMQAVQFYHNCVRAWRPKQFGVVQAPTLSDDTHPANFVGRQLAHYIKMVSLRRGALLLPGCDRRFAALWSSYASTMLQIIGLINFFIRGGTFAGGRNYIYSCLYTLMRLDLPAHWSLWHAHIRGSIAYVNSIGGVTGMLTSGRTYGPPIGFTRMLSEAIMFSTTTPARMQITDYYHFTEQEMRIILLGEYDCDMPAPMDLRIAIFKINRLRFAAATATKPTPAAAALTPLVHRQLNDIDAADVDDWCMNNAVYGLEHTLSLARIFRLAVRLFALLTLPRSATTSWARAVVAPDEDENDPYRSVCAAQRTELLARMRALFPQLEYQPNLRWPMVVAGVATAAAANGDAAAAAADRAFISESLRIIWEQPVVACGPMRCRELLQRFWASGKTEWEECFVEPVPC
ncbi:hypothetical protein BB8028_0005g02930 [Beauveria bassiana]|uniref:Zn(2)-C6 fungal-type domain-containing protein n=1 Tax=Beauveria bassiana TaxID=176275 RepID=A0A2S7YF18_BEABA|nr:hypothetical protein BB8028_0005g02930 [Beauveria bassiana]